MHGGKPLARSQPHVSALYPGSAVTWQPKRASPKTLIPRLQRQRRRRRIAVLARDLVLVEVVKGTGFAGMKAIIVGGGSAALLRR
jgi:hypothetical protein